MLKKLVSSEETKVSDLIDEYEEEVIERGKQEVEMSLTAMKLGHDWDKLMEHPTIKLAGNKISDLKNRH